MKVAVGPVLQQKAGAFCRCFLQEQVLHGWMWRGTLLLMGAKELSISTSFVGKNLGFGRGCFVGVAPLHWGCWGFAEVGPGALSAQNGMATKEEDAASGYQSISEGNWLCSSCGVWRTALRETEGSAHFVQDSRLLPLGQQCCPTGGQGAGP